MNQNETFLFGAMEGRLELNLLFSQNGVLLVQLNLTMRTNIFFGTLNAQWFKFWIRLFFALIQTHMVYFRFKD